MSTSSAQKLITFLQQKGWHIRCVESCTAGALTAALGKVSGVSAVLDRSWITYSNQAKVDEVNVPPSLIETYGVVSKHVVIAMADGAVKGCEDDTVSLSISGIAGPEGGTDEKPVGTVWIGLKIPHQPAIAQCFHFKGDRSQIQAKAVGYALAMPLQD